MKKISITIILFIAGLVGYAQKTSLEKAADSTCKCMEASKSKVKSPEDFNKVAESCIMKSAIPFFEGISKEEGIELEDLDKDTGEMIGKKIGLKLVSTCPTFVELIAAYANDEETEEDGITGKISGTITEVTMSDLVYLNIKESSGKITKVAWIEYFPGSDNFKSNPSELKGKSVEVEWKQSEIYSISQKDFVTLKQIKKLKEK